jgi:acyl-CoA thioesterase-2
VTRIFSSLSTSLIFDQIEPPRHTNQVSTNGKGELGAAIDASLDALLAAIDMRPIGADRFASEPSTSSAPGRVLGGQLLAQAVVGAAATVEGKDIHSLHAAFTRGGTPGASVEVAVTRVRDGRSTATREVTLLEEGAPLLVAIASFGTHRSDPDRCTSAAGAAAPADVPLLQEWAAAVPTGRHWIEQPPAVEFRLPEAPSFLTGATEASARAHWMRLARDVGASHVLNAALLAYASDFFLMDMIFRLHPDELGPGRANAFSLDHAIWFHRPVRFDRWHLHTQEAVALVGDRGLARGSIHDAEGRLIASVAQEVLLRLGASP